MSRTLVAGVAGLACATLSLPARASLPGGSYGVWSWTVNSSTNQLDLGVTNAQMTCFLSGIGGDIGHASSTHPAGANVYLDGTEWKLQIFPGTSGGYVEAHVTCLWVPSNTGSPFSDPYEGSGTVPITNAANTECFLGGILAYDNSYSNSNAKLEVFYNSSTGYWDFTSSGLSSGTVGIATCVSVPSSSVYWENNWTGTFTVPWQQTSTNPVACGLRGIGGAFTSSSDSVNMNWPASNPGYWQLVTTDSKAGWMTCLE